jgi:PAS domain S-box-containing protein
MTAQLAFANAFKRLRVTSLPRNREGFCAVGIVVLMLGGVVALGPFFRLPLVVSPFLLPVYLVLLALIEVATAVLLLVRARVEGRLPLATLAAAFVFNAPLIAGALLSLPGSAASRGVFGPGLQSSAYCSAIGNLGFPLALIVYGIVERRKIVLPFWLPSLLGFALSALGIVLAFAASDSLPPFAVGSDFTSIFLLSRIAPATFGLVAVAVLTLQKVRVLTTVEIWTAVAASAATLEAIVGALAVDRFSVGWYVGRALGAVAGSVVLCAVATHVARVARAIHDRLGAEEALRTLAQTIPEIVWTALPDGRIDWANKRWYDYTGTSEVASPDAGWRQALHPDDGVLLKRRWPESPVEAGETEIDVRLLGSDGVFRWFLTRVVPVRDSRGNVVRWYGASTNVDEQRHQAENLRELYAREHRLVGNLQRAFLPGNFPGCAGLAFSHVYLPAASEENVGGDWCDAFRVGDRRIAVCVGDVSGHGLDAAVRMLRVRELVRAAAFDDPEPAVVLERAALALATEEPEHIVTALYGVVDCARRTFTYAGAGHPPPVFLREGLARSLPFGGIPLGVVRRPSYVNQEIALREGDVVTLYTDGLTEAQRDPVEGERLLLALLARGIVDAGALARALVPPQQLDDVAVTTIAVGPLEASAGAPRDWSFVTADALDAEGARASFALYLSACGASPGELANAELAFGELLCNVVRHAPGPVEIELTWRTGTPYLTVSDRGLRPWADGARQTGSGLATTAVPELAESGRGLDMLAALGMNPAPRPREGGGTQVVVALPCPSLERLWARSA